MKAILLLFSLLCFVEIQSQVKQVLRKEIEKDEFGHGSTIVLENGVLNYGILEEKNNKVLNLLLLNQNFEEQASRSIDIPEDSRFVEFANSKEKNELYFMFVDGKTFEILHIDTKTLEEKRVKGILPLDLSYKTIRLGGIGSKRVNDHFIFYVNQKKKKMVFCINIQTGEINTSSIFDTMKKFNVRSFEKNENNNTASLLIEEIFSKKEKQLKLLIIDEKAELLNPAIKLEETIEKKIIDVSLTWLSDTKFTLTGTYSIGGKANSKLSSGIYFAEFENFEQNFVKYYSFTDFKNFFEYLDKRSQNRVEKKIEKKKSKGVEEVVKTLIKMHPVITFNNTYTLLGEVYYPTYRSETRITYVNGKPTQTTVQVFDGYQYSHAVILNLDNEGEKNYDQCYEMYLSHKPFYVAKNIHVKKEGDQLTLYYISGTQFKVCNISSDGAIEKDFGKIELENSNEKVISTSNSNVLYWYENYFISFSSQNIKNKEEKIGNRKRYVLVLTKFAI